MIKRLGFSNFFSFKEYAEISFEYDKNVPKNVSQDENIGTVIGIKGANGSGKTNIIRAINFFFSFCLDRFNYYGIENKKETDKIPFKSFFNSTENTRFDIEFLSDGFTYLYELELNDRKIIRETLIRHKKRDTLVINRDKNGTIKCLKEYEEIKKIKLRSDQSIISIVDKFEFKSKMIDLRLTNLEFIRLFSNVDHEGYFDFEPDIGHITKSYKESPDAFKFIKKIIMSADSGISDIIIKSRQNEDGEEVFYPLFCHNNNNTEFQLTFKEESSGTKELYKKLLIYNFILENRGLLSLDEFDVHLHANILPMIVNLFTSKESNPKRSQFIFTAHNTEIIDTLGRYRTILVNKDDNESYCYRLDEIKGNILRNDRPISPVYKEGKIGGVPQSPSINERN